jgi:hypothetical protein
MLSSMGPSPSTNISVTVPDPELSKIWERFSRRFSKVDNRIPAQKNANAKVLDCKSGRRLTSHSDATEDLVHSVMLSPCNDVCQHSDEGIDDAYRLAIRPDGLVEILPPARDTPNRAVEAFALKSEPAPTSQHRRWPMPTQICENCSKYDFSVPYRGIFPSKEELHEYEELSLALAAIERLNFSDQFFHKNYPELQKSAKTCAACQVFLSALPKPDTFKSDDSQRIVLRIETHDDKFERSLWYIEVGFPSIDSRHPGLQVTRYGIVDVIAAHGRFPAASIFRPTCPLYQSSAMYSSFVATVFLITDPIFQTRKQRAGHSVLWAVRYSLQTAPIKLGDGSKTAN